MAVRDSLLDAVARVLHWSEQVTSGVAQQDIPLRDIHNIIDALDNLDGYVPTEEEIAHLRRRCGLGSVADFQRLPEGFDPDQQLQARVSAFAYRIVARTLWGSPVHIQVRLLQDAWWYAEQLLRCNPDTLGRDLLPILLERIETLGKLPDRYRNYLHYERSQRRARDAEADAGPY